MTRARYTEIIQRECEQIVISISVLTKRVQTSGSDQIRSNPMQGLRDTTLAPNGAHEMKWKDDEGYGWEK